MDEDETLEKAVGKKCKCGGLFKVTKTQEGTKTQIVCDNCETGE